MKLELISLVSKVSFTCKFFFKVIRITVDLGRSVHVRVVPASERKPLPKKMHYELLLKDKTNNPLSYCARRVYAKAWALEEFFPGGGLDDFSKISKGEGKSGDFFPTRN